MSSNIPYAPVTLLDTAVSIGPADATIQALDFRFSGEDNYALSFIGTLTSIGTGDNAGLQVSPDYKAETAAGAMWQTIEVFATTAFNGVVNGPWAAIRFIKPGAQTAKVVGLAQGRNRAKPAIVG